MKKHFPLLLLPFLLLISCTSLAHQKDLMTPVVFAQQIAQPGAQILDVRTPEEYTGGHIKNAVLADISDKASFEEKIKGLDRNKPVYAYCRSGRRSAVAAERLKANGFTQVYNLDGGIEAWMVAEKPVEKK